MTPLAHYQALGRRLEQARSAGDSDEVARLEGELRHAPPVIRYLYLGDAPPPLLGETPPPPSDQLEQLMEQVRAPAAPSEALPTKARSPVVFRRAASAATAARPRERGAHAWRSAADTHLRNVLAVDPDERMLGAWRRAAQDHNLLTAVDVVSARQLASTQRPDLAIIELRLGDTSGIDLIREFKRELPEMMVVLCSGYLSVAAAVAAVRAGADIVVFKPITFREILERVLEPSGEEHNSEEHNSEELDCKDCTTLMRADWQHLMRVLQDCTGNVSMAARRLGIHRSELRRLLYNDVGRVSPRRRRAWSV